MAMIWITQIKHSSPAIGNVRILQNDPTWHPVINGHQFGQDEDIVISPHQTLDAKFLLIPWAESGRLNISFGANSLNHQVGPVSFVSADYLRAFNANTGEQIEAAEMGPRGVATICSIDVHLLFVNNRPLFQFHASSGTGTINLGHLAEELVKLAAAVLAVLV